MITYRQNISRATMAEKARQIAQEHYLWAIDTDNQTDGEILHSIGLQSMYNATPNSVISALERTWLAMQCGWNL